MQHRACGAMVEPQARHYSGQIKIKLAAACRFAILQMICN
jgi:hypothetical protein